MTTVEPGLNGDSHKLESPASAIRKAREGAVTDMALSEVRREIRELAVTMGAVSMKLVEVQKEALFQGTQAEGARQESLTEMKALVSSGRGSFNAMAQIVKTYPDKVEQHLRRLDQESERRVRQEKWKRWAIGLIVVTTSFISAWGGSIWQERQRAMKASSEEAFVKYLETHYPKVKTTYWERYQEGQSARDKKK